MCDDKTVKDANEFLGRSGNLTRRQFGTLSAGVGLALLLWWRWIRRSTSEEAAKAEKIRSGG